MSKWIVSDSYDPTNYVGFEAETDPEGTMGNML